MRLDLHNHTSYSHDGVLAPARLLRLAAARGIDCLAVTDHDTLRGAWECRDIAARETDLPWVIPGMEILTSAGELVGLFLEEEIPRGLPPAGAIERIRDQGGLVYLPHPYDPIRRGSIDTRVRDRVAAAVDIIEGRNGRALCARFDQAAQQLAKRWGKVCGAGSDAHYPAEVGRAYVEVEGWVMGEGPPEAQVLIRILEEGEVCGGPSPAAVAAAWASLGRTGLSKGIRLLAGIFPRA